MNKIEPVKGKMLCHVELSTQWDHSPAVVGALFMAIN